MQNTERIGPRVSFENVSKVYGNGDDAVTAVDSVSFDIRGSSIVGLLGANGAGKTTLIKMALGLITPTDGSVTVNGVESYSNPARVYEDVSSVLEGARNTYWRLTPRENVEFFARLQGIDPADRKEYHDELLETLSLTDKEDEPVNELSRGMKQKVAIACSLARETDIVFLDEPTLGLDVQSSRILKDELRNLAESENRLFVISSHDMDVVQEVCDRVVIMKDGEVVVDDTVPNLIDLFRPHAYRVAVEEQLTATTRTMIEREYPVSDWETTENGTEFEVTLDSQDAVYDLIADLQGTGAPLREVASVEPDLEDVFVEVATGDEPLAEVAP